MYLEKIELQGFKTFALKTSIIIPKPHELTGDTKGITAIVGPNGSGKSNISDAIRWVLGEQSLKLLRLKKAEDVVFSGSEKKARTGMAEVSIFLNNEDQTADIDYSQVQITRRLYRSGDSEYLINNSPVRLFDILMLLAKANFGQKSYSIVGQGMIDYIVNISPSERKEFFDEATGIKQYQIKRDQSANKLNRTRENLEKTKSTLKELEPHLKSLTRQIKKLEARKELENELRDIQKKYYRKIYSELLGKYENANEQLKESEKQKETLQKNVASFQNEINFFVKQNSISTAFNELQNLYSNLLKEKNNLAKELLVLNAKKEIEYSKQGKQNIAWLENKKEEIEGRKKEITLQISEIEEKIFQEKKLLENKIAKQTKIIETFENLEKNLQILEHKAAMKLSLSQEEIKTGLKKIYEDQKNFVNRILKIETIDQLNDIKKDADKIFLEVKKFYDALSTETDEQKAQKSQDVKDELKNILLTKDNLVNEINELKTALQISSAHKASFEKDLEQQNNEFAKIEKELSRVKLSPDDKNGFLESLENEKNELQQKINLLDKQLLVAKQKIDEFNKEQEKIKEKIFSLQEKLQIEQNKLNFVANKTNDLKVTVAKLETHKENLEKEILQEMKDLTVVKNLDHFENFNVEEGIEEIKKLKTKLDIIGGIDPEIVKEYKEISERYNFLAGQVNDLQTAIVDLEKIIGELDKIIKTQFNSSLQKINKLFSHYFTKLFLGGKAKLEIVQKENEEQKKQVIVSEQGLPVEVAESTEENESTEEKLVKTGIDIIASPPHKKVKNIASLSGGERTMTAIALICAIIANTPSPFVFIDEVDAALDEANSSRFANIIKELSRKTQFLMITHNRTLMETADVIYGVSMTDDGTSRLLSIKFDQVKE